MTALCYVGEIRPFAGCIGVPEGWHDCDGSLLQIDEHETLFNLLGTQFGGDGMTTFGLPDLRDRIPIHAGYGNDLTPRTLGAKGGVDQVTLTPDNLGHHNHVLQAVAKPGRTTNAKEAFLAIPQDPFRIYLGPGLGTQVALGKSTVGETGGRMPVHTRMPTTTMRYIIALYGDYPSAQ